LPRETGARRRRRGTGLKYSQVSACGRILNGRKAEQADENCRHKPEPEGSDWTCGSLPQVLGARLLRKGIRVIVTDEKDPERAVRRWLEGTLGEAPADSDG
jgi:hypothetical protein